MGLRTSSFVFSVLAVVSGPTLSSDDCASQWRSQSLFCNQKSLALDVFYYLRHAAESRATLQCKLYMGPYMEAM